MTPFEWAVIVLAAFALLPVAGAVFLDRLDRRRRARYGALVQRRIAQRADRVIR
jgi:hypothetical protein